MTLVHVMGPKEPAGPLDADEVRCAEGMAFEPKAPPSDARVVFHETAECMFGVWVCDVCGTSGIEGQA